MEANTAAVTVNIVVPLTAPEDAVTVVVPVLRELTRPLELIVATEVFDEDQATFAVTS